MAGMICTQCFRETHTEPKFDGFPASVVIDMCKNWLCDQCLNDLEREIIALPKPKSS